MIQTAKRKDGRTVVYAVYQGPTPASKQYAKLTPEAKKYADKLALRKEQFKVLPTGKAYHADGKPTRKLTEAQDAARVYAREQRCKVVSGEWTGTMQDHEAVARAASKQADEATLTTAVEDFVKSRGGGVNLNYRALAFKRWCETRNRVKTLADVTRADAEAYREHRRRAVGASTLRKDLVFARSVFAWARKRKLIAADCDPFADVKLPKEPAPTQDVHTHETAATVRAALLQPWARRVWDWLIGTGMNRGEVCDSLRWRDVNLESETVFAPRNKSGERRTVYLTPQLLDVLAECKRLRPFARPTDLVFLDDDGERIKPTRLSLIFKRAHNRAKVPVPRSGPVHVLRHTFLTRMQKQSGDPVLVKELAGHADVKTTMRYVHVSADDKREAVRAMHRCAAAGGVAS